MQYKRILRNTEDTKWVTSYRLPIISSILMKHKEISKLILGNTFSPKSSK